MRGRSYTPSPPPRYSRRGGGRSPSPRRRYAPRQSDLPTSLLVRNLRHDYLKIFVDLSVNLVLLRTFISLKIITLDLPSLEDLILNSYKGQQPSACLFFILSIWFGLFRKILSTDFTPIQPRGFGFIQFVDPADAADAKYHMDGQVLLGRELTVVFAEENRKKPTEMRVRERSGRYSDRRRSPARHSRSPRYSRSPPPRHRSRSRGSRDYYSPPKRREYSRSLSPEDRRHSRERSQHSRERSYSRSPPKNVDARSRSQSPVKDPVQSRSPSPNHDVRESPRSRSPSQ
ncbi:serine/arginine-rich splicing factor 33-like protein [Trifolium pratense]|uniref:Serine/arginine-rich splicing factor 33-like protein n=1 Tax=Trifolium pratense TaxID=57577 RepID=A0A2K3NMG6_TRIPR|nr:serine/arginine-rich splicing factor 33-like protein [Trifolium pratense]PNY11972.1 serine/arginine-rich splicing factor 33-like protein [Trifolium pratense]PNY11996.1 serine/arginine-rich splicing factor 33-like protein [Trifolium pratense]